MKPNDPLKIVLLFIVFLQHRAAEQNNLMPCSEKDADLYQGCNWQTLRIQLPVISAQVLPLLTFLRSLNGIPSLSETKDRITGVCLFLSLHSLVKRIYQSPNSKARKSQSSSASQSINSDINRYVSDGCFLL